MNTVAMVGNLTKDPELKSANGGAKFCVMRVAESNGPKSSPNYINVKIFGRDAENSERYLSKGREVGIVGQLRLREWDKDGKKGSEHWIAADRVDFLGSKKDGEGQRGERSDGDGGGEDF